MKKIFIVEDDKSICMELVEILENEGYAASYLTDFELYHLITACCHPLNRHLHL